jgi:cell division protein FtsB
VRLLTLVLLALLVLIQYPLWLGKGSWLRVWEVERQLVHQNKANERLVERNRALEGEVKDLKQGTGAIEERARYELGMMRPDEVFVQVSDPSAAAPAPAPASGTPPVSGVRSKPAPAAR